MDGEAWWLIFTTTKTSNCYVTIVEKSSLVFTDQIKSTKIPPSNVGVFLLLYGAKHFSEGNLFETLLMVLFDCGKKIATTAAENKRS